MYVIRIVVPCPQEDVTNDHQAFWFLMLLILLPESYDILLLFIDLCMEAEDTVYKHNSKNHRYHCAHVCRLQTDSRK